MTARVETGHEDDQIDEENPVQLDGSPRVAEPGFVARALEVRVAAMFPISYELSLSFGPHHLKCVRLG